MGVFFLLTQDKFNASLDLSLFMSMDTESGPEHPAVDTEHRTNDHCNQLWLRERLRLTWGDVEKVVWCSGVATDALGASLLSHPS